MKRLLLIPIFFFFILLSIQVNSQIPVIVKDWATYMGNSEDSIFKTPLVTDSGNTYVGSFTINTNSGADILITKYNDEGQLVWTQTWTGPGNGRDQASAIFVDDHSVYVTGITFTSVANNFDFVTMRLSKTTGAISWVKTHNGTASNYDVATAITAIGKYVYVTGLANNLNTSIDYTTIKYAKTAGIELWNKSFDHFSMMDIPFGISIIENDTLIAVTGASQKNLTDWDYATITYENNGVERDTNLVSGTASGFDRAQAVKTDAPGNIYITGTISQSVTGYDIKTVKIAPNGNVNWQVTYDNDSSVDEGVDLIVDAFQNVYICGKSYDSNSNYDYVIRKYNSTGVVKWTKRLDLDGGTDEPKKMCFDSFGNIIITGKGLSGESKSFDFFTAALDTAGTEIWRQTYGVIYMEDDQAQDLAADENGNIYITGEVILVEHGNPQTVTIKYRSDYFTDPQQVDTPSVANYYYTNYGQIVDENGNATDPEKVHYYTIHHYPHLYFQEGMMSMVFSHIDADTSTEDTLQRVDVSFWHGEPSKAFPVNEKETSGYYNYFLAHCPDGITNVQGNEKLLYENVYEGIDGLYSSNNAGLKLYFICSANSDPSRIGLFFEGQDNLQIVNNWGLQVETSVGNYEFEKPRVYRINENGNVRNTNWQLSWEIPNPGEAKFSGLGEWGPNETLIIEISRPLINVPNSNSDNLEWCTYFGGEGYSGSTDICNDAVGNIYSIGNVTNTGTQFPTTPNVFSSQFFGFGDLYINKFKNLDELDWCTFYGGSGNDIAQGVAIDNNGVFVTGITLKGSNVNDLPINATFPLGSQFDNHDGFISKFNLTGRTLIWGNIISSSNHYTELTDVDVDISYEKVVVVGNTYGNAVPMFTPPTTTSYYQQHNTDPIGFANEGIIYEFDLSGIPVWSSYFGGDGMESFGSVKISNHIIYTSGIGSTIGSSNNFCGVPTNGGFPDCVPTGSYSQSASGLNSFIAEFDINGTLNWATRFGNTNEWGTHTKIDVDETSSGTDIYLVGSTNGTGAPFDQVYNSSFTVSSNSGNYDMFIANFHDRVLRWSTLFGGNENDWGFNVAHDSKFIYFIGQTNSSNSQNSINYCQIPTGNEFPICNFQTAYLKETFQNFNNSGHNIYIGAFDKTDLTLIWSTYLGESFFPNLHALMGLTYCNDQLYFSGETSSSSVTDFPIRFPTTGNPYKQPTNHAFPIGCPVYGRFNIKKVLTGISDVQIPIEGITIYPNPSNRFFKLYIDNIKPQKLKIKIMNTFGRILRVYNVNSIDLDNYNFLLNQILSGTYLISIEGENLYLNKKLVIIN